VLTLSDGLAGQFSRGLLQRRRGSGEISTAAVEGGYAEGKPTAGSWAAATRPVLSLSGTAARCPTRVLGWSRWAGGVVSGYVRAGLPAAVGGGSCLEPSSGCAEAFAEPS